MKMNSAIPLVALLIACGACNSNHTTSAVSHSGFIHKDTANIMINSYLASIGADTAPHSNDNLFSLLLSVDDLRSYLDNASGVTTLKLMLAHSLEYIEDGHSGQDAGYKSGALTLIIAGFDREGNYVFAPGNSVLNHLAPCPTFCPTVGSAAANTLQ
jgi:hypothetical protein